MSNDRRHIMYACFPPFIPYVYYTSFCRRGVYLFIKKLSCSQCPQSISRGQLFFVCVALVKPYGVTYLGVANLMCNQVK